ncbi:MAG TPA: deoxyribonuclease IV, partial [Candidatus Polarisedimenticolia bacterium]|nr:deoxyribonuclease IV [Candidatus Polarisedimenticolia bacterium]
PDAEVMRFKQALARAGIERVVAHDSYLINLCSPDDALWQRSIDACVEELQRCERLGIPWLVAHPGGHMGQGEAFGIRRMAEAIDLIHDRVPSPGAALALETTAGQGTVIGHRFEQIAAIIARTRDSKRIGVCLDTCHVFASGYDLRSPAAYSETMRAFEAVIGFDRLCAVHVNDSKKDLGCHVDRHEHIGKGFLGLDAFRFLMNDARLHEVPLLLETPKGDDCREDVENLATLMGLVGAPGPGVGKKREARSLPDDAGRARV